VARVLGQLRHTAATRQIAVIAYCFMPDHLHLLAEGTAETSDLRDFVRLFKQQTSFEWKRRHAVRLWQRNYYEHVLRADEDTLTVARYIIDNPVRAGMVRSPDEYPYLGSLTLELRDLLQSVLIIDAHARRT
jgi:REP-associated tyrosine transposase